jgi:hypothetical protein
MTTMTANVAARLVQDTQIASYVSSRVYSHDIRLDGPESHPEIRGPYGFVLPHIVVDDGGGLKPPFGPPIATLDTIRIWIFAENSSTGRTAIDELYKRVLVRLHRWQEANTKASLFFANRTGFVADPPPGTGAMESMTFTAAGMMIGVSA